jgi:hypothetical protein
MPSSRPTTRRCSRSNIIVDGGPLCSFEPAQAHARQIEPAFLGREPAALAASVAVRSCPLRAPSRGDPRCGSWRRGWQPPGAVADASPSPGHNVSVRVSANNASAGALIDPFDPRQSRCTEAGRGKLAPPRRAAACQSTFYQHKAHAAGTNSACQLDSAAALCADRRRRWATDKPPSKCPPPGSAGRR